MQCGRIEQQITLCENHLASLAIKNPEVEHFLVQYLLIRVCAEFEEKIVAMFAIRCSRGKDGHVKSFAKSRIPKALSQFNIGDIAGVLGLFGQDYKNEFQSMMDQSNIHCIAWNNLYTNRTAVAHGSGAQMTIAELRKYYTDGSCVLDALASVLGLKPHELRSLR